LFLEVARLRIGAVKDGAVARITGFRDVLANALDDETGLVLFVVGGVESDAFAFAAIRPQLLAEAATVARDNRVGRVEDRRGGAVVLLQADGLRAREVVEELLHVFDFRPAPAVDGLVVVADDEGLARAAGKDAYPRVLQRVGVLEFVDEQVAPAILVVLEYLGIFQ